MASLVRAVGGLELGDRCAPNCPRRASATALCIRRKNAKRTRVKTSSWERRGDHRHFAAEGRRGSTWLRRQLLGRQGREGEPTRRGLAQDVAVAPSVPAEL